MNAILTIFPYRQGGTWVFDDPAVGLLREPFVAGIPEMIDLLTRDIPGAERGFRLLFSASPFPGSQASMEWVREETGGNWYRWPERALEGWLCPALFKYFEQAPERLYARAEAKSPEDRRSVSGPATITIARPQAEELLRLLDAGNLGAARAMVAAALE